MSKLEKLIEELYEFTLNDLNNTYKIVDLLEEKRIGWYYKQFIL